jgi:hypothetical protein
MRISRTPLVGVVVAVLLTGEVTLPARAQRPALMAGSMAGMSPFFRMGTGLPQLSPRFSASAFGSGSAMTAPSLPYGALGTPTAASPFSYAAGAAANPYGNSASAGSPYDAYSSSSSGYSGSYGTPVGDYLRGTAGLVTAEGGYLVSLQQAQISKEKSRQEQFETRRRTFDQHLYERGKTPTWEGERQRFLAQAVQRSLHAPAAEVWSGHALNTLLDELQRVEKDRGLHGAEIPLDGEVLRHINVTTAENAGNPGLLKNEGRLSWPLALRDPAYETDRGLLDTLTPVAIRQAVNGRVDAGTLRDLAAARDRLQDRLLSHIRDLPSSQYIEARRYLHDFEDALGVFRQSEAGGYFTAKYTARGETVPELVRFMLTKGLRFAPAVSGDEGAYVALHAALAAYAGDVTPRLTAGP